MSFLSKVFGDENEKYLKKSQLIVERINSLEKDFEKLSDKELAELTFKFKKRIEKESLDDILSEAFAVVREAAKRTLKQRHFDVQLIGGIALHQGKIAEMKTGEGKTLAATLAVYLNALEGKGVHLVTVNDYLAKRDAVWMGQIYYTLGLSVSCIVHDSAFLYNPESEKDEERDILGGFKVIESFLKPVSRKEAYLADITYGTNHEFGFDYLRDNMVYEKERKVQRELNYAIIDEVDSILIDEARTPMIISAPDVESSEMYKGFANIIPRLKKDEDYEMHEKEKAVTLTEKGIENLEKILGVDNIYEEKGVRYLHHLEQALRAEALFKKDINYVVKDGQIVIIDEFTGRLMHGRRWSGGLHQAVEAKERLDVQPESLTLASISIQNYFRMYKKLAGMTGTAATSAEELSEVYKLDVVIVPTNKPMIRKDLADVVYKTEKEKLKAIVDKIKECYQKGQPVLVGTRSIEKNEYLGKLLEIEGIPHQILNAKNHQKEGEIIAQAGKFKSVTVATNMAGRGVDIILGGNPPEEAEKIKELGGLFVLGTERHEARRIDNQLRGRSGRQGDLGASQFFLSLEDDLMRIFGGDRVKNLMESLRIPDNQPIESKMISKAVESAQAKIEGMNFDLRKHLLEYDDVMNIHRDTFYKKRNEFFNIDKPSLRNKTIEILKKQGIEEKEFLRKEKEIGEDKFPNVLRLIALRVMDSLWIHHLEEMSYLRDKVKLRVYGQMDPLVEYKNEGYKMFQQLLKMIDSSIAKSVLNVSIKKEEKPIKEKEVVAGKKVGRNDPCPCGSGKKYKRCCWPKYG